MPELLPAGLQSLQEEQALIEQLHVANPCTVQRTERE
jgi:hypothetical protein